MTRREPTILLIAALALLALSRVGALEPGTWVLEIAPILIIAPILVATASRFRSRRSSIASSSCTRSS